MKDKTHIDVVEKSNNLLKLTEGTYTKNGITLTVADDGLISINGTASAYTSIKLSGA